MAGLLSVLLSCSHGTTSNFVYIYLFVSLVLRLNSVSVFSAEGYVRCRRR